MPRSAQAVGRNSRRVPEPERCSGTPGTNRRWRAKDAKKDPLFPEGSGITRLGEPYDFHPWSEARSTDPGLSAVKCLAEAEAVEK